MSGTTDKWNIPYLEGGDIGNLIDDVDQAKAELLDDLVTPFDQGALGSRPTSTAGTAGIEGREYRDTATGVIYKDFGTGWTPISTPPGVVEMYAGATAPEGWLLCDGSAVSRSTYAALFAALGTTFGVGNGSTTFNLPDFVTSNRGPVGAGGSIARGAVGGEATHVLTTPEMPSHTHGYQDLVIANATDVRNDVLQVSVAKDGADQARTTAATGGGGAHNNRAPYLGVLFIVKT